MENLFEEAIIFASNAHAGMLRKACNQPYMLHPMEAAVIIGTMTDDPEVLAAAVLHDVVEDAGVSFETIREKFGNRVADLVSSETENKRVEQSAASTWEIRKSEAIDVLKNTDSIDVKMLYLGDKLFNLRSIARGLEQEGDRFWCHFNQQDTQKHYWYYRSIANAISELSGFSAWQEFDNLVTKLFVTKN